MNFIDNFVNRRSVKKLNKAVLKEYKDDPTVTFVTAPAWASEENAPHGVNTPEEMTHSAVSDAT